MCQEPAWHPASAAHGADLVAAAVGGGVSTFLAPSAEILTASLPLTNCADAAPVSSGSTVANAIEHANFIRTSLRSWTVDPEPRTRAQAAIETDRHRVVR